MNKDKQINIQVLVTNQRESRFEHLDICHVQVDRSFFQLWVDKKRKKHFELIMDVWPELSSILEVIEDGFIKDCKKMNRKIWLLKSGNYGIRECPNATNLSGICQISRIVHGNFKPPINFSFHVFLEGMNWLHFEHYLIKI